LQSNNYGAVIQHIEPEHLQNIIIPNAPETLKKGIHELVVASYGLRDQSNDLLDCAERILYEELQLIPIFNVILNHISQYSSEIQYLRNPNLTKSIILPGRFKLNP
jgi:type I restriction enzyme S subunit